MNWRRLEPSERYRLGDEVWCECGHWRKVFSREVGRLVGGTISRRDVVLMNHNPTDEELINHTTVAFGFAGRAFPFRIPGDAGNFCVHSKEERINPDPRVLELPLPDVRTPREP